MQSSSSGRPFKPGLVGASPTTDANLWLNANCPRSSDRLERRSAKAEVAGAIPAVDAISQDCGVTSSISPCEGDGPGANPGFLTISFRFRWAEVRRLSLQNEGVVAHRERAAGCESGVAGSIPACEAPYLRRHLSI